MQVKDHLAICVFFLSLDHETITSSHPKGLRESALTMGIFSRGGVVINTLPELILLRARFRAAASYLVHFLSTD